MDREARHVLVLRLCECRIDCGCTFNKAGMEDLDQFYTATMSALWSDDTDRDVHVPVRGDDEADWLWKRGVRFRLPSYFSSLRELSLKSDVERKPTG